ncbi:hypothetical protein ACFOEY_14680 [Paracandidimonas soli]|uniref:hypothetical protein n=1 Tax=Paracandidimonas soli TaxID=1917182 RepID=UPI00361A1957
MAYPVSAEVPQFIGEGPGAAGPGFSITAIHHFRGNRREGNAPAQLSAFEAWPVFFRGSAYNRLLL